MKSRSTLPRRFAATLAGAIALFVMQGPALGAAGDLDSSFAPTLSGSGYVHRPLAEQPDGKVLTANASQLTRYYANGTTDTSFSCMVSNVNTIIVQADGKILIGGAFTSVNGSTANCVARLFPNGSLDPSFVSAVTNIVRRLVPLPNGKYMTAGDAAGSHRSVTRLNADGSLDSTFYSAVLGYAYGMAVLPDGKVVVSGDLRSVLPPPFFPIATPESIVLLNSDGTLNMSGPYENPSRGLITDIKLLRNGNVVIGGSFKMLDSTSITHLAVLTPSLGITSFDAKLTGGDVADIVVQTDGKIVIGGRIASVDGVPTDNLVRLSSTGVLDTTFNAAVGYTSNFDSVDEIAMQMNGKILVSGDFAYVNSIYHPSLARLENDVVTNTLAISGTAPSQTVFWSLGNSSPLVDQVRFELSTNGGGTWTSLGTASSSTAAYWSVTASLPTSGVVRAVGSSQMVSSDGTSTVGEELEFTAYTAGDLDMSFNPNSSQIVYATAQQLDGKIVIGGIFGNMGGVAHSRLARVNLDGSLDSGFNPTVSSEVHAIVIQPDGKIVIGGEFGTVNGVSHSRIARLNADGTLDSTFITDVSSHVHTMALQPDGKILIGGEFTQVDGVTRNRIARLNADGTLDTSFNPNASQFVRSIALQPDGKIVVGGVFTQMGGTTHNRIARINSDGSLDSSFNAGANDIILAVAIQADGKIVIGGLFTSVLGTSHARLARLNADGTVDSGFTSVANDNVYGIALQADGKIYIYGHFTLISGVSRGRCARLNADGTLDTTMNPGASSYVYSAMLQAGGELVIAGQFTQVQSVTRNRVARLHNDLPFQNLSVAGVGRVQWQRGGGLPEAVAVWFETSTDGGLTWTNVGNGSRISGGWELSGLTLPSSGKLRARAITRGGKLGGSNGLCELVTDF